MLAEQGCTEGHRGIQLLKARWNLRVYVVLAYMTDVRHIPGLNLLDRIGKSLRERFENLRQRTIPERWVTLLKRLNAEEVARRRRDRRPR